MLCHPSKFPPLLPSAVQSRLEPLRFQQSRLFSRYLVELLNHRLAEEVRDFAAWKGS